MVASNKLVSDNQNPSLICPLTQQTFVDPVIDHEGNTYERNAILGNLKFMYVYST